ncbi:MAG: hypothetical protein IJA91_04955 [Clostridia bacterium]|nr:hypothetical protein [Clostridia bacterium]
MNLQAAVPAKRWGLSASTLKIIACVTMLIDHVGAFILTDLEILRMIGRIAFPIFAYFIAEGCRYTRNKLKRFLLVFGLAIICEGAYLIYDGKLDGGILLTFSFSILLIYQVQAVKKALAQKKWMGVALWTLLLAASLVAVNCFIEYVMYIDYGFWGVLIPVFTALPDYTEGEAPAYFRYISYRPVKIAFWILGMLLLCIPRGLFTDVQSWCLVSVLFLSFYNGTPGIKRFKYGFYIFYPAHLVVIYLVKALLDAAT